MGRVGNQIAVFVKDRTREIVAFFDVHRIGGVGEGRAHLFGNGHEQVVEHFQHHRIDLGADRLCAGQRRGAASEQGCPLRRILPANQFQNVGASGFCQDRGALDHVALGHLGAVDHGRVVQYAVRPHVRCFASVLRPLVLSQRHGFAGFTDGLGG